MRTGNIKSTKTNLDNFCTMLLTSFTFLQFNVLCAEFPCIETLYPVSIVLDP